METMLIWCWSESFKIAFEVTQEPDDRNDFTSIVILGTRVFAVLIKLMKPEIGKGWLIIRYFLVEAFCQEELGVCYLRHLQ